MRNVFIAVLIGVCLSGCNTMKVGSTDGIKEMFNARNRAVMMRLDVDRVAPANKQQLVASYNTACVENNSWIDGLMFDVLARNAFSVTAEDYLGSPGKPLADHYMELAGVSVTNSRATSPVLAPPSDSSVVPAATVVQAPESAAANGVPLANAAPAAASMTTGPSDVAAAPAAASGSTTSSLGDVSLAVLSLATTGTSADAAVALAILANKVVNNIIDQHDVAVEAARSRIHGALEEAKWKGCN